MVDRLQSRWDGLNARKRHLPILDYEFIELCRRYFGNGAERWIEARLPGGGEALALVREAGLGRWETFQASQAPLGAVIASPGALQSDVGSALLTALPRTALALGLYQQDPSITARPDAAPTLETLDYIETGSFTAAPNFMQYWAQRGANLRQNVQKQLNRLERERLHARVAIVDEPEAMIDAVHAYAHLERAGWKASGGTALVPGSRQSAFYCEMLTTYARRGEARVLQFFVGERLLASDLCLLRSGTLIILKTTHDESERKLSSALLMRRLALPQLAAAHEAPLTVEFFGPMMEWHARWAQHTRRLYHVNVFRHAFARTVRAAMKRLHSTKTNETLRQ